MASICSGVTLKKRPGLVISNSWSSCEDQVPLSVAQSIDAVLQTAAAAGISVFNSAGDTGATCLNGSASTVGVPADSPNATAVGGTSLSFGRGFLYGGEKWWNGTTTTPPTGQGGFGVSNFFSRPSYQDGIAAILRPTPAEAPLH
jgi:subtilase family serine protease